MSNPLLTDFDLAPFSKIKPEHIKPAIEETLDTCKELITQLLNEVESPTWENTMLPLDQLSNLLDKRWSPVSHLNAVVNSEELRTAYDSCLPLLSEYSTWIGQNEALYQTTQKLYDNRESLKLNPIQIRILINQLRDFKLAGISLSDKNKLRYGKIKTRLSELSSKFDQNVLDSTMSWSKYYSTPEELIGLPESALGLLKQNANQSGQEGFLINLEFPSYFAIMTYAESSELRHEVYKAYSTRASELSDNVQLDNSSVMNEILSLKAELATLLGFSTYTELSLATKMAETPDQVFQFLNDLAERSKEQALIEFDELKSFSKEQLSIEEINPWDVLYISEKLKQKEYSISQEELKPYFPIDSVLNGLFKITETLFNVTVEEFTDEFESWHSDARLFEIFSPEGERLARFYLDLFARKHKRGGAWMADFCSQFRNEEGRLQRPVAFLTCNFNPPVDGKPALLTHDEVVTLFHEFGHGLHHMLTKMEYLSVSGINGVEWDAVELPSQFMENFCYEKHGLDEISGHYQTQEKLPDDLLLKLQNAKNFQSAMFMMRQIEFSLFDFQIHHICSKDSTIDIQNELDTIRKRVSIITPPSWNRFQNSFSHIFAGGYAAGYYSYKWAEVLSADAFSKFEEDGVFNREIGQLFKSCVLEKGGSNSAMELFKSFRGRPPEISALLRHSGIK